MGGMTLFVWGGVLAQALAAAMPSQSASNRRTWPTGEKTIYIARHGQTGTNRANLFIAQQLHPDAILTEHGSEQADSLATLLEKSGVERIYISRMVRSQQTAGPVAKRLRLDPFVRSQLDEMDFGTLEGKYLKDPEVAEALEATDQDCSYRPGGSETRSEVNERVNTLLEEIFRYSDPKTVLVIGHYGTVREMLALLLNLSCEDSGQIVPKNDSVYRVKLKNGKLSHVALSQGRTPFKSVGISDLIAAGGR